MKNRNWIEKLQKRWHVKNGWQVLVILIVFACTGFTVLFIKKPLLLFFTGDADNTRQATILYYILILPIYNVLLLGYGFMFGQWHFFLRFEKQFFNRILSIFRKHK